MDSSIRRVRQEYGPSGVLYDLGSVYAGLLKLTDVRKAKGKIYSLDAILMIIVMAKLCGVDSPYAIADWAKNHQMQLVELLQLKRPNTLKGRRALPSHHTIRRIMGRVVYEEEVERLVAAYNEWGEHGEIYAMDGKALRGVRKKDEDGSDYLLSLYDVEQAKVMSQVAVGRKENEITKAPETLKKAEISRKIITADALLTQKAISAQIISQGGDYVFPVKENQLRLYQNIQQLFAPEYPRPGFAK